MTRILKWVGATALAALLLPVLANAQVEEAIDNSALQAKVKAKLMEDDVVEGSEINLETEDGVVQLGGFIDDEAKAKKAAKIVASVEGVKSVDNQLHAKSGERSAGQAIDDGMITTKVKAGLAESNMGMAASVNVDTYNGVVLLTGFVDNAEEKSNVEKSAAAHDGVKKVINGTHIRK
jgi:hyperosmotically inducible periplasmic protein